MRRTLAGALIALGLSSCTEADPLAPDPSELVVAPSLSFHSVDVLVTNERDDGPGSFRAAIAAANADPSIGSIALHPRVRTIRLQSGVLFTGPQDLTIDGNRATVDGSRASAAAFTVTGGGDLALAHLTFRGAPGEGVLVEVPSTATGVVNVSLTDITVIGNGGHGVLVNDQVDPSTQDDVQPNGAGSDASVHVEVIDTRFVRNGYTVSDRDGLRVNEGGLGDLRLTLRRTVADDNAADGIEIDERGAGDVFIDVSGTQFTRNGKFDPADLDDGFDIDEYDAGGIFGRVFLTTAADNYEEGFDFNENNAGDLKVDMTLVAALRNGEEGIDLEEDDDFGGGGDLVTVLRGITTIGNGDGADGALKIREKEDGNLDVTLVSIYSARNTGSGIFVRESSTGSSVVRIDKAVSTHNTAGVLDPFSKGHGIEVLESGAGDLTGTISSSAVLSNAGNGIFGDETGAGAGTVTLTSVTNSDNALGTTGGTATFLP
ncbi:MAG: hypothetical protein ABL963_01740 [Longimicrobiales bacterium]